MVLAQLGAEVASGRGGLTAAPSTYREVVSKTEPGSSQWCVVGGQRQWV